MKDNNAIRVLIVDDWTMIVDGWLRYAVKVEDIEITHTATTEKEALEMLATESFDVAIIDMELVRGDHGESGLRLIQSCANKPDAPRFIAISGVALNPQFIDRARRAGAVGYILKTSSDHDQLFDAIRKVHRGQKEFPQVYYDYLLDRQPEQPRLTDRELKIWQLLAEGKTNNAIAKELAFTETTIKAYVVELYSKLGITNRALATRKWMEEQYGMQEIDG